MTVSINLPDIRSRAAAAFVGLAVGDSLGAPVEFMTTGEIAAKYGILNEIVGGGWLRLKPGQVTDDTEMSLCAARAIASAGGWSLAGIAGEFAAWLRSKPIDVGDTCRRGIRNFMLKGMLETPFNQWDGGNGAAMRMLPTALFTLGDDALLERCAVEQARLTHNHPLSDAACITLGRLVHLSLRGASKPRLRREADQLIAAYPTFAFDPYRGLATGYVVDTMQTVFHHFFRGRSFEECLTGTVNQGGDADTTGAICGMLAGAFYGMESIPRRWLKRMDRRVVAETSHLSTQLVALSPALCGRDGIL
ncbi:ADP-ribosyl-[dinitrogen reductase] hydrolase [Geobacter pickeringii]|uniref:ADP-ribosyl-(Dinitrogen reductase) hydrolase n=1 Tax=Geobacter pickeringii TaxID=345632 RepID=A0A0B5BJA5_9BACT|nr:ADP-ribosyl-[dinitrogen reductase] hydrolase [Geobacter pickeringii]AJE04151.1 ADP-ribosyl-(dinitrogen reductase) hydrolase [Geobacter pickeringii]